MTSQKTTHSQSSPREKEHAWRYHDTPSQIIQHGCNEKDSRIAWHKNSKNRQLDQWNGREDSEISQQSFSHLNFDKGTRNT